MKMTIETTIEIGGDEVDVSVTGDVTPGARGRTYGPPERCSPPEPAEAEIIYIVRCDTGTKVDVDDVSDEQERRLCERLIEELAEEEYPDPPSRQSFDDVDRFVNDDDDDDDGCF